MSPFSKDKMSPFVRFGVGNFDHWEKAVEYEGSGSGVRDRAGD